MPRTTKKTVISALTTEPQVSIADAAVQLRTNEQTLRLALMDIRPDDFDTVKALSLLNFEAVSKKIEQQQQPQLNPVADVVGDVGGNPENLTQQASEGATQEPQKSTIVPSPQQQQLTNPSQSQAPNNGLSLIEQFTKQVSEEVQLVDAVAQVRNTLILNNLAVRDAELVEGINQHWQNRKTTYLDSIRGLADLAQTKPDVTPDNIDVTTEINSIMSSLGKYA